AVDEGSRLRSADQEHARATPALGDDRAEDLERRERVLARRDAEPPELRRDVGGARARIVGEVGDAAAGVAQRGQRLRRPRIQLLALPDAAIEVEDEAAQAVEHETLVARGLLEVGDAARVT